jgi:hypothetical protein
MSPSWKEVALQQEEKNPPLYRMMVMKLSRCFTQVEELYERGEQSLLKHRAARGRYTSALLRLGREKRRWMSLTARICPASRSNGGNGSSG